MARSSKAVQEKDRPGSKLGSQIAGVVLMALALLMAVSLVCVHGTIVVVSCCISNDLATAFVHVPQS